MIPSSLSRSPSLEELKGRIPEGELFAGKEWRWAPVPYRLAPRLVKELDSMGHRLLQFAEACDLLYRQSVDGRQPAWIAGLLDQGKPPEVVALGRDPAFRGQIARVIRPDLILTEEGFSICELDQIPGGIGLTAWLNETYSEFGFDVLGGAEGMLKGFASVLPEGEIIVSEEAATYRPEMEWLAARLARMNAASHWSVSDDMERESWGGHVYRFFEMFDLPQVPCSRNLFRAASAGSVTVTPPPKAQLEEKLWMALFWMPSLKDFWLRQLGERGVQALQRWIPYTWIMDPSPLPHNAVYPRLEIQDWKQLVGFSQKPYILQTFRHSVLTEQPYYDAEGALLSMTGRARLSPYFFLDGRKAILGGVLSTVCPADKKILHGMSDAVMVPVVAG
ncbi:MAG: hypothetical protein NTW91_06670 [Verrucomicrobia bacterium]|nr:hypothetical protein [Verrucomicrobiota bacterium]